MVLVLASVSVMAYSHWRTRIRTQIGTRIPNPIITLYYVEVFTLVWIWIWIWIPTRMVSQMVTVPILWMDLRPNDGVFVHSNFTIFQSGDQSQNLNQWEISAARLSESE